MLCPNCGQQMNVRNVDNEIVLHCGTCGSSFFDKGDIDTISTNSARILTEEAQGQYILGNQKVCPKDKSVLLEKVDPNLPKNTVILECPSCSGIFAYPDDLLKYKGIKASQPLSAGSFKLLPAPKSLFMLASFAVLSLAVLLNIPTISNYTSSNARASTISINNVHFSKVGPQYFVLFSTSEKTVTSIVFYDAAGKQTLDPIPVSASPATVHQIRIPNFDVMKDVYYSVILPSNPAGTPKEKIVFEK